MRNLKRVIALLLAFTMVVSLFTACKSDEPGNNTTESVTEKPGNNVTTDTPTPG